MIGIAALTSCNRGLDGDGIRLDRMAVLPFENLTGEAAAGAELSYTMQHAVQAMSGARASFAEEGPALLAGSMAIAKGTVERDPATRRIRLTLDVFEPLTHKLLRTASATDADPFNAAYQIAKALNAKAEPLHPRNPETLTLWTSVLNPGSPVAETAERCKKLILGDPSFGPAYAACQNVEFPRADLKTISAAAFASKAALQPESQVIVGQWLFQTAQFQQAVELLTAVAPKIPAAWNSAGYSYAMLGNIDAARKALLEYRKLGGDEPNAVDSLGEANYITGNYAEAEKLFLECADKFPQTPQGRTGKLKAAAMRALKGDRGGAETLAQSVFDPLRKAGQNVQGLEELWRGIILEQDIAVMRKKIEASLIQTPQRDPQP